MSARCRRHVSTALAGYADRVSTVMLLRGQLLNGRRRAVTTTPVTPAEIPVGHTGELRCGQWHRRVRDVMTTSVVTVDRITTFKEIASLLAEHKVSALPVLMMGRRVAGVVSEADLVRIEDRTAGSCPGGRGCGPSGS